MQAALTVPNADEEKWIAQVNADADAIAKKPPISAWLALDKNAKNLANDWAKGGPAIKTEDSRPKRLAFDKSFGNPNTALGKAWLKHRANLFQTLEYVTTGLHAIDRSRASKLDPYFCRAPAKRFKNNHAGCASPWVNSGLCYFYQSLGDKFKNELVKEGLEDLREEVRIRTKTLGDQATELAKQCYQRKSGNNRPAKAYYTGSDKSELVAKVRKAWDDLGDSASVLRVVAYQKKWKRLKSVHVSQNYGEIRDASRLQFIIYVKRGKYARGYIAELIKDHTNGDEIKVIIHLEKSQRFGSTDVGLHFFE